MHVWGRSKQNKAGWSEEHMPANAGQHHSSGQRGHIISTTWQAASQSLTRCRNKRDPDACAG
jgi:hypothetical protein